MATTPDSASQEPPHGELWTEYAFLENVLREMPVGVIIVDVPSGELILCNQQARELFPDSLQYRQNIFDENVIQVRNADDRPLPAEKRPLWRAVHKGEMVQGRALRADQRGVGRRDLRVSASPVRDHVGKVVAAVGVYRDVTERRLVEAALHDYRRELERRVERRTAELKEANQALRAEVQRRSQVEEELRRSEARFRNLVQQMPAIVYTSVRGMPNTITYLSPQVEDILGYPAEDFMDDPGLYDRLLHPDDRAMVHETFQNLEEVGDRAVMEYRVRCSERREIWLRDEALVIAISEGEVHLQGLATDITERRMAEQRMRASEQRFSQFMKYLPGAAYIKDGSGRILYANRYLEEKLDVSLQELFGRKGMAFWPQSLAERFAEDDEHVLQTGEPLERDEEIRFDGDHRTYMTRKFPIYRPQGPPLLGGISIDITERKEAEHELELQKELFQRIVDNIPVMIVFYDYEGNINLMNHAAEETIGYSTEEAQQIDLLAAVYPDPELRRETLEYMQKAEPGWKDIPLTTREGEVLTTSWANVRLSDGSQIGIGIDVTDERAAQRQIEAYQKELRELADEVAQAEEMERRRIATALHDQMAQLLAFTKMKVEQLADRYADEDSDSELDTVVQNLEQCIRSTRSLVFDLSPPVLYEVGLEAALERLAERVRKECNLEGSFRGDGLVRDLPDEVRVTLYQSARELMMNVVKHAHAERLDVSINGEGGRAEVVVSDDGVGLGPHDTGDAGYGLFNIRERIGRFGGELKISENTEGGVTATLTVPINSQTDSRGDKQR